VSEDEWFRIWLRASTLEQLRLELDVNAGLSADARRKVKQAQSWLRQVCRDRGQIRRELRRRTA
jgi:hypothetical protein